MTDRVPYTYLIGWPAQDIWYYGVRYRKGCHPSDLWNPYKTSSTEVDDAVLLYGEPDVKEIRQVFEFAEAARHWEWRLLTKIRAAQNPKWLNRSNGARNFFQIGPHSEETKRKMSESSKGKGCGPREPRSNDVKQKISEGNKGRRHSEESKNKMRACKLGVQRQPHSEETKRKIALSNKGKTRSEETCRNISLAKLAKSIPKKNSHTKRPERGWKHSEETKKKMSESKMGHFVSNETRTKIAEANKRRKRNKDD